MSTAPQLRTRPVKTNLPENLVAVSADPLMNIGKSIEDPEIFMRYWLGVDLWEKQAEILRAVVTSPRVVVKSCHASGKSFLLGRLLLWFLARYEDSIVITTAPTWSQVEKTIWGEVRSALTKSKYPFEQYQKVALTKLVMGPKRYAYGLSTSVTKSDEGVKFQGMHADNVLVIIDEAPGVDAKIWTAIEGARAGGNVRIVAMGNPTISSGPFHDAFTTGRSGWTPFTISCFDTPNLKGLDIGQLLSLSEEELDKGEKGRTYLTTRRWVKEKYFEWGPGHPLWESRVLGEFPKQSEDALLSLAWLEAAKDSQLKGEGRMVAGLDVAGPGEAETSLTIRRGPQIILHRQWTMPDPRGEILAILKSQEIQPYLEAVNVDVIGIGWYIYQHLLDAKIPAIPVNIAEPSNDSEKYCNSKAEHYWGLRMRFATGEVSGLSDEATIGQLAGIRYRHNSRGQVEIESKEQAAKRGVPSPDRAESIMLCFANRTKEYGALAYYKDLKMEKTQMSTMIKPLIGEQTLVCKSCSATCVTITNGAYRCAQCGTQWSSKKDDLQAPKGQRGEYLSKLDRSRRIRFDN